MEPFSRDYSSEFCWQELSADFSASGSDGARFIGWGVAVPDRVVTNDELSLTLDTTDEWIAERTGIRERRIGGTTSSLGVLAGRRALEDAGIEPKDIDFFRFTASNREGAVMAMDDAGAWHPISAGQMYQRVCALAEVLLEGSSSQKLEAQRLIDSIPG